MSGTVRRAVCSLRRRFASRALILLYHRVAELPSDPNALCVTPTHFAEHLGILRTHYHPMSLQQLVRALRAGRTPNRAVVVTFDDGYADNFHEARPLLERWDVPATVFVTAGYVGQNAEPWWDELERVLLQPGTLPPILRVKVNGATSVWDLAKTAGYGDDTFRRHQGWTVLADSDPTPRHRLYRTLLPVLRKASERERRDVLEALAAGDERRCAAPRATHRTLSADELVRMADGGLIDVGAHTVSHPVLASLPVAVQRAEIEGSKVWLEDVLGRPAVSFAYPFGSKSDYTDETVAIVRDAGFACACANVAGVVVGDEDGFQLPRMMILDWSGPAFAGRLKAWFRQP